MPLRVHTQHFTTGKQHRHTLPSVRLAHLFTKAYTSGLYQYINYRKLVLDSLISYAKTKGILTAPFIYNGLILTRIAYHAIGMIDDLPPPLTQRFELKRTLSPKGSTKTTKSAPEKRSAKHRLILADNFDDEEGTSERAPLIKPSKKVSQVLPEDPSENVIPKSKEAVELQERSDYSALKKIQKERAKRLREEESLSKEEEQELEKDKLIHRDKRTKPKEDPKIAKFRQERLQELNEQTKLDTSLAAKSRKIIKDMMAKAKAKEPTQEKEALEDLQLEEIARRLKVLTRKTDKISDMPKAAPVSPP